MKEGLGELLRALRRKRGLSQKQLAKCAQVTERTLQYWEANQQQPREVELESVLNALGATTQERCQIYSFLPDPRTVRLVQKMHPVPHAPASLLGPLPGIGDLIRAMRTRRGWTQEKFVEEMRVSRATIIRWEATQTLPSPEDIERLCLLLQGSPEEHASLQANRLLPSWSPRLTLEECLEQCEVLSLIRSGHGQFLHLTDLYTLALKRQVRLLLDQSSEALRILAKLEVQHSWWLYMHGRKAEACAGNRRALNITQGVFAPEMFLVNALNLLSSHAAKGPHGPDSGVKLLSPWLGLLPSHLQPFLLCDMALYSSLAQRYEEATALLARVPMALRGHHKNGPEEDSYLRWYYQMTTARVMLSSGKPLEALNRLPAADLAGDGRVGSLLVWAEIYLAANERDMASNILTEVKGHLVQMPLPLRQSKMEQLAQKL